MIFSPIKISNITLKNRIVISPMCQYSAINGIPSQWHYKHLLNLSSTGASMIIMESTAIEKKGKITNSDLCLYSYSQEKNLKKLVNFLKNKNDIKLGIQISHSGRKGSSHIPWKKTNKPLAKLDRWETCAPSSIPKDINWPKPRAMSKRNIKDLIKRFKQSAIRAKRAGFDCLEIHMAHGYLLHQFFSPISNKRTDEYGGSLENRSRLLIEIAIEVKKAWPKNKILGARITGDDHLTKGLNTNDAIYLAKKLKSIGFNYISVSSGGILTKTNKREKEAFRSKMTKKIKKSTNIQITTSGKITNHNTAEKLVKSKNLDFITIAREIIRNPSWIYSFAKKQKKLNIIPNQYKRIF
jgi:2,4-dienoyl-CoA reductase-like NADH-dependent reductase (Old Yellow Enzyme family)